MSSNTVLPVNLANKAPMEWTEAHDVLLCRDMLVLNPFQTKRKTTQRSKKWETVAEHLEQTDQPVFRVTARSVRDRYTLLSKKYRKRMQNEKKASGISPEVSELDAVLEELIGLEDLSVEEKEQEDDEKSKKADQDRVKALDMRKKAMEMMSETKKRQAEEHDVLEPKKKERRSAGDTIAYLRERNEIDLEMRRAEMDLKRDQLKEESRKQDEAAKRQDDLMKAMAAQNQAMLDLISKLISK